MFALFEVDHYQGHAQLHDYLESLDMCSQYIEVALEGGSPHLSWYLAVGNGEAYMLSNAKWVPYKTPF